MKRYALKAVAILALLAFAPTVNAQTAPATTAAPAAEPPREWIDKDTGHRLVRLSNEPGSSSLYFNYNSYTPDGKYLVFSAPSGIQAMDLKTRALKTIVPGRVGLLFVGRKSGLVYYTDAPAASSMGHDAQSAHTPGAVAAAPAARGGPRALFTVNIATGERIQITLIDGSVATINADETLIAGTRTTGGEIRPDGPNGGASGNRDPADEVLPNGQKATYAEGREIQINRRLVQRVPMEIFTVNLKTGEKKTIVASTDWLNHLQFSPTDPNLLMYCHEGNWHIVDRLWLVKTNEAKPTPVKIHSRTMNMEIAGHEWFSHDGKTVWYDLQTPRGEVFWVAGYNVDTGARTWFSLDRNAWGVHFNSSRDDSFFVSDGGDSEMAAHAPDGKWIQLLKPRFIPDVAGISADNAAQLIKPGALDAVRLANLGPHNYRSEPNATVTPDGKWVVFRSNMHGPGHVYAVEIAKAQ